MTESGKDIASVKSKGFEVILMQGDLTEMDTEAIVNGANNDLQHGGGVAGAIRRKGGPIIQQESNAIGSIPVGTAAITSGGKLKAGYVIHAASMELGGRTDAKALRGSTAHSLRIANEKGIKTIAFPAVGTGIAHFPMDQCAEIMLREVVGHLQRGSSLEKVYFVLFDAPALKVFETVWRRLKAEAARSRESGEAAGNA
ncbi:MAG TPA: macro domain-containing protein [Candidatus Acidoferrum sp.]|nr:macro domain-containing protein [Candidatus Acidoferrum sp.]